MSVASSMGRARAAKTVVVLSLRRARKRRRALATAVAAAARAGAERRYRLTYALSLDFLTTREELPALLRRRGLVGTGAEVGVRVGRYSELLLSRWPGRLISIDPWLEAPLDEYADRNNVPQQIQEEYLQRTQERLARFGERSEIWRTTSVDAAARIEDAQLDFVYIDARHDYESVREDLVAWLPKVRPGGLLAGHDYVDGVRNGTVFEVRRAVDEFFRSLGVPVHPTRERAPRMPSWLVQVPARASSAGAAGE